MAEHFSRDFDHRVGNTITAFRAGDEVPEDVLAAAAAAGAIERAAEPTPPATPDDEV